MAETPITDWSAAIGVPVTSDGADTQGTKFTTTLDGIITGVGCRMVPAGTFTAKVWAVTGATLLGSAAITVPGGTAWTYVTLGTAIPITAGVEYIISTSTGLSSYYRHIAGFTYPRTQGNFSLLEQRYLTSDGFPTTAATNVVIATVDVQATFGATKLGGSWGTLEMA